MTTSFVRLEQFKVDHLKVQVCSNRQRLGIAAGQAVAQRMRVVLRQKGFIRVVFASAPSQNEFLAELGAAPNLDWKRVTAFHMDEYVGLGSDAPQSFARFLQDHLFAKVQPGAVHFLDGLAGDPEVECERYAKLLNQDSIDIVCAGIGENGHLAFNDPPYADFHDPKTVKVLSLALRSREQQVHDGCFPRLEVVPKLALTMTIPALMAAGRVYCMAPGPTKAQAVRDTVQGPITAECPATILRQHKAATLYLDRDSAGLLPGSR
jgi:glucosamine-6-phosphate deaminase